jgi:hypothetical protein
MAVAETALLTYSAAVKGLGDKDLELGKRIVDAGKVDDLRLHET